MKTTSRILDLKYKLMTIELLNLAKNYYTYRELAQIIGLPETVLSRYVKGHVLPAIHRAKEISKILHKLMKLEIELHKRIKFDEFGYFDNTGILSDMMLMERAVQYGINAFAGKLVTKILTPAIDGIPLATLLAHRLGINLIVAKKSREIGVRDFIEEAYIPSKSALILSLYVPRGAIKKGDHVLIIDDVIDSGELPRALIRVVKKARAEVVGIFALVSIGDEWKSKIEGVHNCPVEVILPITLKIER